MNKYLVILLLILLSFHVKGQKQLLDAKKNIADSFVLSGLGVTGLILSSTLEYNAVTKSDINTYRGIRIGGYVLILAGLVCAASFQYHAIKLDTSSNDIKLSYTF